MSEHPNEGPQDIDSRAAEDLGPRYA